jgi:hypothetical protein
LIVNLGRWNAATQDQLPQDDAARSGSPCMAVASIVYRGIVLVPVRVISEGMRAYVQCGQPPRPVAHRGNQTHIPWPPATKH